jgi:hypothetical protein
MEKTISAGEDLSGDALTRYKKNTLGTQSLIFVLKGLSHCEKAVERLGKGDKRIFQYNAQGELAMADNPRAYWSTHETKVGDWSIYFEPDDVPFWSDVLRTHHDLSAAWVECATPILQSRYIDDPAPQIFGHPMPTECGIHFPDPLPDLPVPQEEHLIQTGSTLPCSGIWEPVKVDVRNTLLGLVKKPIPPIDGIWHVDGCMNYLHGGQLAPEYADGGYDLDKSQYRKVWWRLLWRDDRYQDGTIPAEESAYIFQEPDADRARRAREVVAASGDVSSAAPGLDLVITRSGQPASRSGRWAMLGDANKVAHHVSVGDPLPDWDGKPVEWVWVG